MSDTPNDPERTLRWAHGEARLQRLAAMLAPVTFRAPGRSDFAPMQVAPWADEPDSAALPGLMRRLRGDWPCVPFGTIERPAGLPASWRTLDAGDAWFHGYCSNHDWQWLPASDPLTLALQIDYPESSPVRRLTRTVRAVADAPALEMTLGIEVRRACVLPIALHPTFRLDAGRVRLALKHRGPGLSYPVPAEPGVSRLKPGVVFDSLAAAPASDGGTLDLTQYPLGFDTEELSQLREVDGPIELHYLDAGWIASLDWDHALLPDAMLWVSHRGRRAAPWNGRHTALGIEPLRSVFDLGRVAAPPIGHPLAGLTGINFYPRQALSLSSRIAARPA